MRVRPPEREHVVQFHGADASTLFENVSAFLARGIRAGDAAIVIATPSHIEGILRSLRAQLPDPESHRLTLLDAERLVESTLVQGFPDAESFDVNVGSVIRNAAGQASGGVVAYGEMVGLLWKEKKYPAAIRLEQLWNRLLAEGNVRLFCGYAIDVLSAEFDASFVSALLCAHSRLISSAPRALERAVFRAIDDVLGRSAWDDAFSGVIPASYATLPPGEAAILRLRSAAPERADEVLERAREYYAGAN